MGRIYRLTSKEIDAQKTRARLSDGGGLFMQVTDWKGTVSRSWEYRFTLHGKTRSMGLGPFAKARAKDDADKPPMIGLTLKDARLRAGELRQLVEAGRDPIAERKAAKVAPDAPTVVTFADALDEYMKSPYIQKTLSSDKHRKQWRASLDLHVIPKMGTKDVATITIDDVKGVLKPIWATKTDTARRVRQRVESVFAWAIDEGCRETDNPASVKVLQIWIKNQKRAEAKNHPAIQQADLPTWFAELRSREGTAGQALAYAVLCASRSGEVRGMVFGEVDFAAKVWTIPAARMKMKKPHSVPLSDAAIAVLKALPNFEADHRNPKALVFPAPRGGEMSDMTISAVMKRMHEAKAKKGGRGWVDPNVLTTPDDPAEEPQPRPAVPHGLRSTFKDWATKRGFDNIQSELALAHNVGNEVEQRYRRTDLVEERRAMMEQFAAFCLGEEAEASKVVPLRAGVA
ncbi:site-specific integrase [Paracoccus nototheniae]|uniref:Tyrosine-type recombinase/integrase n=1 Tax=Paracoccus nototheniae TaxID=2489002 RepID=A0ABW4DWX4_9RHOB|nr:site-specific integrase [Paracoccus nototheniae]